MTNTMQQGQQPLPAEQLVGTWRLLSCEGRSESGEVIYPYGEETVGMLMYDAAGNMSVMLMRRGRPHFASGDLAGGTPQELKAAFEGFDAYCGRYTLDGATGTVTHHVLASKFPNWVGTEQDRYASVSGDTLDLSSPPLTVRGEAWIISLVWQRVS